MKRLLNVLCVLAMAVSFTACSSNGATGSGVEDGVLTIAMECAYAPYNWTQTDDSNGAVPIKGTNEYANGYDIMIAKKICEANNWELEVIRSDWDSLVPSVQTGVIDAAIAGQSMTKERSEQVDFAGPYYYASFAILVKKDSELANLTSIHDFGGYKGTAQLATIWYTECLPQMDDEEREENVNIGISVRKGNTELKDAINSVLSTMTTDDFNEMMNEAIKVQPLGE